MFRDIDKNGDGQITKEEFLSEMMKTERRYLTSTYDLDIFIDLWPWTQRSSSFWITLYTDRGCLVFPERHLLNHSYWTLYFGHSILTHCHIELRDRNRSVSNALTSLNFMNFDLFLKDCLVSSGIRIIKETTLN